MAKAVEKEKNFIILDKAVQIISAVNNSQLAPYLDIFRHYPENILLQPLGTLTGFFRINEFSEDSAYIVNFLSSVLKKEYYLNPKRSIENSLDSALRKINLALSEIVKEGNINWLGKIDGVVCILEKNNLHFSVCGKARVLLFRNQILTEISKDMATEDLEPNPLKTFINVSSGRLEQNDRIIICGNDILEIFSFDELRKGALRFSGEKFSQFLKTALTNKLELVGTIVVDIFQKKEVSEKKPSEDEFQSQSYNFFSKKSFEATKPKIENLKEAIKKDEDKFYTDEKTGHIYIQEDENATLQKEKVNVFWPTVKEKISDFYYWLKNKSKKQAILLGKLIIKSKNETILKIKSKKQKGPEEEKHPSQENSKLDQPLETSHQKSFFSFPNFGKIKRFFGFLNFKQKIYSFISLILILVVPLIYIKIKDSSEKRKDQARQNQIVIPDTRENLAQEKNIIFLNNLEESFQISDSKKILDLNGKILALNNNKIIFEDQDKKQQEVSWPENFGTIINAASMKDLNLILILTEKNQIISFFPTTLQFKENSIQIPTEAEVKGLGSYLTYLYIFDSKKSQIYRYPRAENGFGEKTNWLKDDKNLSESCCLVIDENVYLAENDSIIKMFKGKIQDFNLEKTINPIKIEDIFTNSETSSIYILDKEMGRVIEYSKNGEIINQYFNEDIKKTTGIAVDEKNNQVFLMDSENVKYFNLQ